MPPIRARESWKLTPKTRRTWLVHIAERFRAFRTEEGLTQEELACKIRLPFRETVTEIEAGRRELSAVELLALLAVCGRTLEDFWE